MTPNLSLSPSPSSNDNTNANGAQLRYGYLLLREDGTTLPLVAIDDLPSTITVPPSLNIVNGMTLLEEICPPRSKESPETALSPPAKRSASVVIQSKPESTPQNPNSVVQHQDQIFTLDLFPPYSPTSSSPATSVTDSIRDAVQPRILFPNIPSPPPTESHTSASPPPTPPPKNGPFYVHPHSQDGEPTPLSSQPLTPPLPITKPCPTYTCPCHDVQPTVKTGQFFIHRAGKDGKIAEGESSSDEASSTYGDSPISGEVGSESVMHQKARRPKIPKSTEPCAYFHRRIGCKRGRDCLYVHDESTGKDKDGSTKVSGQALGLGPGNTLSKKNDIHASTTSSRNLEGKWRRTENGRNKEAVAGGGDDNQVISDRKRPMTMQNLPAITCPTPGRALSSTDPAKHIKTHCTFFLRFGECDYWPACKFSHERPEGTSRWRGSSKLPSGSKWTPGSKDGGGQSDGEEAANEKGGRRLVRKDVKGLPAITERKRNSSLGSSESSSSYEDSEGDSDVWLRAARGRKARERKAREGQLISLFD